MDIIESFKMKFFPYEKQFDTTNYLALNATHTVGLLATTAECLRFPAQYKKYKINKQPGQITCSGNLCFPMRQIVDATEIVDGEEYATPLNEDGVGAMLIKGKKGIIAVASLEDADVSKETGFVAVTIDKFMVESESIVWI